MCWSASYAISRAEVIDACAGQNEGPEPSWLLAHSIAGRLVLFSQAGPRNVARHRASALRFTRSYLPSTFAKLSIVVVLPPSSATLIVIWCRPRAA